MDYQRAARAPAEKWEEDVLAAANQAAPLTVVPTVGETVADIYGRDEAALGETKAAKEDFAFASRPHKVNLFTTYRFVQGRARGMRLGGGVIYQSPDVTGRFFYYNNSANGVKTVLVQPYN